MANYPLPKFHFRVDWGGVKMSFTEVSGLDIQIASSEYRQHDSKDFSKIKMPGLRKFSNITLKRGKFDENLDYNNWLQEMYNDGVNKHDVIIHLVNEQQEPVAVWKATRCVPVKVTATALKSEANEVAIESIEIAHEGLTLERRHID